MVLFVFAGMIFGWPGDPADLPSSVMLCDGRAMSSTTHPGPYAAFGTAFGTGSGGGTDYNLPDLRGRSMLSPGGAAGLSVGATAGALTTSHTHGPGSFVASHDHDLTGSALVGVGAAAGAVDTTAAAVTGTSGSDATSILHPVMAIHLVMVVLD